MKKDTNAFLQLYDKLTNKWKQMAILSPGFHVRNIFGNYAQSYLDVGVEIFSPETHIQYCEHILTVMQNFLKLANQQLYAADRFL